MWLLITQLPPESATHTALRDSRTDDELAEAAQAASEKYGRWSKLELLVAQLIDEMARVQWTLVALKTPKKSQQPPVPTPYPRPGVPRRRKHGLPTGPIRDYLEGMRAAHRDLTGGDDG